MVIATSVSTTGAGASYRYGRSLTRLLFTDTHFRVARDNGSMPTYEINEVFQLIPATTLMGGYWYSKLGEQKFQNGTLLLDYALSKRTVFAPAPPTCGYRAVPHRCLAGGRLPGVFQRAVCRLRESSTRNPDRHAHEVLKPPSASGNGAFVESMKIDQRRPLVFGRSVSRPFVGKRALAFIEYAQHQF